MLDLGASINVMPYSIYASLNLGPLKQTEVIIQLADQFDAYPEGVIEDVLVKVNELIFPADFYILHMEDSTSLNSSPILLGRPFVAQVATQEGGELGLFAEFKLKLRPNYCCLSV